MSDIVERLNRAGDLAIPGEPCAIFYDAANEIERLRITALEEEAIRVAIEALYRRGAWDACEKLRGLLKRTG